MSRPSTSVVICAYTADRWDDLRASVASAAGQFPEPDELWLVVDHNPSLLERAERELAPLHHRLQVVANSRKKGLSGARNTALELVGAEVVVFLDDDASPEPGWLNCLTAPYSEASVIAVGGAAQPCWPTEASRPVTLPASDAAASGELDWVVGCTYAGQPRTRAPVRNLMGCNMSFRRDVFVQVGGFSEDLGRVGKTPLGCEETELCIRARGALPYAQILFEPRALVSHHVSADRLTWTYLRRRCFAEGLSKATVAKAVGQKQALQTERTYATKVLPKAVWRELGHAIRGKEASVRARRFVGAFAIVFGLSATTAGYVRGLVSRDADLNRLPALLNLSPPSGSPV